MEEDEGDESMFDASAIYEDVHSFTDVTQMFKEEIRQLEEKNAELVSENKRLTEQVKTLADTSRTLNKNFSSVYRTARAEIQRLTFQNQELQKKYDELLIRRSSVTDRKLVNDALARIRNMKPLCIHDFEVMEADFGKVIRVPDSNFTVISSNVSYSFSARQITPPPEAQSEEVVADPACEPVEPGPSEVQYERPRNYDDIVMKDYEQTASLFIKSIKSRTQHGANERKNERAGSDKQCGGVTIDSGVGLEPVTGGKDDRQTKAATDSSIPEEAARKSRESGSRSRPSRKDTEKSTRNEYLTPEGSSSKPTSSERKPSIRKPEGREDAKKRSNTEPVLEKEVKQVEDWYENKVRHTRDHKLHRTPRVVDANVDRPDYTPDSGISVATSSTRLSSSIDSEPERRKKEERRSEESRRRKTEYKQDRTRDVGRLDSVQGSVTLSSEVAQLSASSNAESLPERGAHSDPQLEREGRKEKDLVRAQEQRHQSTKHQDKHNPKYEKVTTKDRERYTTDEKKSTKTKDSRKDEKSVSNTSTRSKEPVGARKSTTEKAAKDVSKDSKDRSLKANITNVDMFKTIKDSEKTSKGGENLDKTEDVTHKSSSSRNSLKNESESSLKEQKSASARSKEKSSNERSIPSEGNQRSREKEKSNNEKEKASGRSKTNGEKKERRSDSKEKVDVKKPRRKIGLDDYRKRYSCSSSDGATPVFSSPDDTLENSRNGTFHGEEPMEMDRSINNLNSQEGMPDREHERTRERTPDREHERTREGTPNLEHESIHDRTSDLEHERAHARSPDLEHEQTHEGTPNLGHEQTQEGTPELEHELTQAGNSDLDNRTNTPAVNTEGLEALRGVSDVLTEKTEVQEKVLSNHTRRTSLERVGRSTRGRQQSPSSAAQDEKRYQNRPRSRDEPRRNSRRRSRSRSTSKREGREPESGSRRTEQESRYNRRPRDVDSYVRSRPDDYRRTSYQSRSRYSSNESSSAESYSENRRDLTKSKSGQSEYNSRGRSPKRERYATSGGDRDRLADHADKSRRNRSDNLGSQHRHENKSRDSPSQKTKEGSSTPDPELQTMDRTKKVEEFFHEVEAENVESYRKCENQRDGSSQPEQNLESFNIHAGSTSAIRKTPLPTSSPEVSVASHVHLEEGEVSNASDDSEAESPRPPKLPENYKIPKKELAQRPVPISNVKNSGRPNDERRVVDRELSPPRRRTAAEEVARKSSSPDRDKPRVEQSPRRRERYYREEEEDRIRSRNGQDGRRKRNRSQSRDRSRSRERERSRSRDRERSRDRKRRRYRSRSNSRDISRPLLRDDRRDRRSRSRSRQRSQTRPRADRRNSSSRDTSRTPPKRRSNSTDRSKLHANSDLRRKQSPSFSREKVRRRSRDDSRDTRPAQTRNLRRYRSRSTSRERSRPRKDDLRGKIDHLKSSRRRSSSESRDSPNRRNSPRDELRRSSTPQFSPASTVGPGTEAEVSEGLESEDVCRSPTPIDLY